MYINKNDNKLRHLRKFHNFIKMRLIADSCNYMRALYNYNPSSVLDLCVGNGGDCKKYYDNGIMYAVCFDIDENSIAEAKRRYFELVKRLKRNNVSKLPQYYFYALDLSDNANYANIQKIIRNRKFDIVSCQFAIHYFFKNADSLCSLLNVASKFIKKNGIFIGTTMDGGNILKLTEVHDDTIENDICKIQIDRRNVSKTSYGNHCTVMLGNPTDTKYFSNGASNEYLVDVDELIRICSAYKLNLLNITPFNKWYNMNNECMLTNDEREFSFLNFSFVFIK